VAGYDNHFGHRTASSTEGFDDYVSYGKELGISVIQGTPFITESHVRVSSSRVRNYLLEGDVCQATHCLGRPYEIEGTVVSGQHIGTALGFPTANLQPSNARKLIPAPGVYAVQVCLDGSSQVFGGMMNIGCRPTFGGDQQTLEVHIFHFSANIYGRHIAVRFISRLRAERQFDSHEALTKQLVADARQTEEILNQTPLI
jgi:riboflavin kinase/FMN adenylyltransferase